MEKMFILKMEKFSIQLSGLYKRKEIFDLIVLDNIAAAPTTTTDKYLNPFISSAVQHDGSHHKHFVNFLHEFHLSLSDYHF